MRHIELMASIITIAIGVVICIVAIRLPFSDPHTVIGPGALPLTIGILTVAGGVAIGLGQLLRPNASGSVTVTATDADDDVGFRAGLRPYIVLSLLFVCAVLLRHVSFGAGALVLVSGYLFLVARRSWVFAIGVGLACTVLSYVLFHTLLGAPISLLP